MLLHARFFSEALLSVEDVAQSTLTLGGAGGLNSAYMHPLTLETFREIETTSLLFFLTLYLKVFFGVLFHNSVLVGTFVPSLTGVVIFSPSDLITKPTQPLPNWQQSKR